MIVSPQGAIIFLPFMVIVALSTGVGVPPVGMQDVKQNRIKTKAIDNFICFIVFCFIVYNFEK